MVMALWACQYEMKEVALELIKIGKSKPNHITKDGTIALSLVRRKRHERCSI